jgi:adenosylhomocysteine nucleosidase
MPPAWFSGGGGPLAYAAPVTARLPLIVAATAVEIAHVPSSLPRVITGLGKTAAAVATTEALTRLAGEPEGLDGLVILNVGTAGALRDGLEGLHLPGTVFNHDINADAIRALGFDPREELVVGGDDTVLASGDLFVTDPVVRARLAEKAHLVDMEGYAVALAAHRFEVEVTLVKHVSDNADDSAHDWATAVAASAVELGEWVTRYLDGDVEVPA